MLAKAKRDSTGGGICTSRPGLEVAAAPDQRIPNMDSSMHASLASSANTPQAGTFYSSPIKLLPVGTLSSLKPLNCPWPGVPTPHPFTNHTLHTPTCLNDTISGIASLTPYVYPQHSLLVVKFIILAGSQLCISLSPPPTSGSKLYIFHLHLS